MPAATSASSSASASASSSSAAAEFPQLPLDVKRLILYRGDSRPPAVIFEQGFALKLNGDGQPAEKIIHDNATVSGRVSTTANIEIAIQYAAEGFWVYALWYGGLYVPDVLKKRGEGWFWNTVPSGQAEAERLTETSCDGVPNTHIIAARQSWATTTEGHTSSKKLGGRVVWNPHCTSLHVDGIVGAAAASRLRIPGMNSIGQHGQR